ncbi:hypothetical protein O6H91_21G052400 [Diphasiastrum complanatum]|uniref:Uncharacterized protein n=2 Tax=Diphasiastrum complanatum TaxID=34168 RepID=A0ACC2AKN0_DIPCM|nr:hypothetical protein O6H91_21G052400 [Diphasiastrum complanatum]KAJ7518052.1 hypothetical protein O6H91_21G052400 [Diphasiastrum complanatum]
MSGARLCGLLADLGYEGWQLLDPDSFEWPFQYEETGPLLDWLCTNLRASNVLSLPELQHYRELLAEGKIMEGEDLDFAYESISAFASKRSTQEAVFGAEESLKEIKEATVAHREEAALLQKRLQLLQSQVDALAGHTSALIQGRRGRVAAASMASGNLMVVEEKLGNRNLEINTVLEKVSGSARELAYYHSGEVEGIYISFADLRPYTTQDLACTKELNQWFVKQFDVGPSRLVVEEGKSKCSWFDAENVCSNNGFGEGDAENSHQRRVMELQRLRSVFGVSERQWVEAQVENAKQQAVLVTVKLQASADQAHVHGDLHSLRRRHAEIGTELYPLVLKEEKLLSEVIPSLCWELAQLQDTYILQGDYDLKVMRQEYYISQQKRFISHLVDQLARHRFLQIACHLERKTMSQSYELLRLIESELDAFSNATMKRIERCLALSLVGAEVQEQGAIDDRDIFLHRVRDLLNIYNYEQGAMPIYVSAPGLIQQLNHLQSDLQSLQTELDKSLAEDKAKCTNELCNIIQRMQQLLFASSTTAQPILTPWPLMKELGEMEKANSQLSAAIEDVTREHCEKAEIVKHHPHEVGRERQVFVDFFCAPERLRSQVRDLAARVKAMQA